MEFHEPRSPWPVTVTSKDNAKGRVYLVYDPGHDEHAIFMVVMDDSREVWWVPNPEIRFQSNWTFGRRSKGLDTTGPLATKSSGYAPNLKMP